MPMVVCSWFYAHGDVPMVMRCTSLKCSHGDVLHLIEVRPWLYAPDISHGDVPMVLCPWWCAHGVVVSGDHHR